MQLGATGETYDCILQLTSDSYIQTSSKQTKFLDVHSKGLINCTFLKTLDLRKIERVSFQLNRLESLEGINQVDFPQLRELLLQFNQLTKLNQLSRLKWPKLRFLGLTSNLLASISCHDLQFPSLKQLRLDRNILQSIQFLPQCPFSALTCLNLSDNRLTSLECLRSCNFKALRTLSLENNQICLASCLSKCLWWPLQRLNLNQNYLKNCDFVSKFPQRQRGIQIWLQLNLIVDFSAVIKTHQHHFRLYGNQFIQNRLPEQIIENET